MAVLARLPHILGTLASVPLLVAVVLATPAAAGPSGDGVFDTICEYSHTLEDDPLMHPGHPGMSHVHDFFGNRLTDAASTGKSLLDAGKADHELTTCRDADDFAAYWTPALYRDGEKLDPFHVHAYYRNATSEDAVPFPVGLGMVAGDPMGTGPNEHVYWQCTSPPFNVSRTQVPTCPNGDILAAVTFQRCWNGNDLFVPDQSHVAYAPCDSKHPVRLPAIILSVRYPSDHKPHDYRLASGAITTYHADFFDAWLPKALAMLVTNCLNEGQTCEHDENYPPKCSNFLDDDTDSKRDFPADPDCSSPNDQSEYAGPEPQCSNRKDDDRDGLRDDKADPGCSGRADDSESDAAMPQCSDGKDNDGNGKIDYPADPGCSGRPDGDE